LQPVADGDAHRLRVSAGGWCRARRTCLLSLPQGVLRRARFTASATCPGGSGPGFISKPAFDPRSRRVGLDLAGRARG